MKKVEEEHEVLEPLNRIVDEQQVSQDVCGRCREEVTGLQSDGMRVTARFRACVL